MSDVEAGIANAIEHGTIGFDAVKHLVLCRIERRPPRLDMTVYPFGPSLEPVALRPSLPKAHIAATAPGDYMALLEGSRS